MSILMDATSQETRSFRTFFRKDQIVVLILGLACVGQLILLVRVEFFPLREEARSVRDLPAQERSAILSFGDKFSAYMTFLNDKIPEEATVVVPPMSIDNVFGNPALIQYFLFPRVIMTCQGELSPEECVDRFSGEGVYFLAPGNYYTFGQIESGSRFISFAGQRGVLVPRP